MRPCIYIHISHIFEILGNWQLFLAVRPQKWVWTFFDLLDTDFRFWDMTIDVGTHIDMVTPI